MRPLSVLILSDGRPGHYHLSDGVAAAIGRRRPVVVRRLGLSRRRSIPGRMLATAATLGAGPAAILRLGYGITKEAVPAADVVISAGGDTLAANVAAARLLGAANIFCGTLRHYRPEAFALVVSSYARHAGLPRHLVALKPNGIDPDTLQLPPDPAGFGAGRSPRIAGLLIGGPSGLFKWRDDEWQRLLAFLGASHQALGVEWVVSTSRRTPDTVADLLQALASRHPGPIARLIDFRHAGPGTLPELFGSVEVILATEDSSTMLSEAVCARLPVVGVAPQRHAFKDEEAEYRTFLTDQNWCRCMALAALTPETFLAALSHVRPLQENHLDRLAAALAERLPGLFAERGVA